MIEPKVLAKGIFSPENILITLNTASNRKIDDNLELELKEKWQEIYKDAKNEGKLIYNGESYRLDKFKIRGEKLYLETSLIKYEKRISLNKLSTKLENLGEDYYCKGISIGGLVKTTDRKYLFGVKADKSITLDTKNIDVIGGIIEGKKFENGFDLLAKNKAEILEETGIPAEYISEIKIVGLILTSSTNVIIVTSTKLNIGSTEAKQLFTTSIGRDEEMKDIIFCEKENLIDFLHNMNSWKPVLVDLMEYA